MGRAEDYRNYLRSDQWASLRKLVLDRASGQCELCGVRPPQDVHHIRYPKRFDDDHPDNLLALCGKCHEKQHGIRCASMSQDIIDSSEVVVFSFVGKGKEYRFEFRLIENDAGGRWPWIPIREVEQALYCECEAYPHLKNELTPHGRVLDAYAASLLDPSYRMVVDGVPWVRASGVFQILQQKLHPACNEFRRQLGDWLESAWLLNKAPEPPVPPLGDDAIASGLAVSSQLRGSGLRQLLEVSHLVTTAISGLVEHDERISELAESSKATEKKAEKAIAIAEQNASLVRDMLEDGWLITIDYLRECAPGFADQETSMEFGKFLAAEIKKSGGRKDPDAGWFLRNGDQASKLVPWPGTVARKLNKWRRRILDIGLMRFRVMKLSTPEGWAKFVGALQVKGIAGQLASRCHRARLNDQLIALELDRAAEFLRVPSAEKALRDALAESLGMPSLRLAIECVRDQQPATSGFRYDA